MGMKRIKLGEVCEIVSGSTPKTGIAEYWDGDIDWITPAELTDETYVIKESKRKITYAAVQKTGLKSFPKGTVILSSRAPIGKVAIAGKEMYCNQGFKNFICSDQIDNRYLYWYLKGKTDYLNSLGRGATFKEISKTIVENIEILLPDIDEQINCSDILKKCWDLILKQKEQIKIYDELIKSRFIEMFGDPVKNQHGYPLVSLSEYIDFLTSGSRGWAKCCVNDGDEWFITIKNVKNCRITTENMQSVHAPKNAEAQRTRVQEGDLLISITADLGRTGVVSKEIANHGAYINQHLSCIRLKKGKLLPLYVAYFMESPAGKMQFFTKNQSAVKAGLNFDSIKSLRLLAPPINLQEDFVSFIDEIDKLKFTTQKSLEKTQLLFNSLMQQYFG